MVKSFRAEDVIGAMSYEDWKNPAARHGAAGAE